MAQDWDRGARRARVTTYQSGSLLCMQASWKRYSWRTPALHAALLLALQRILCSWRVAMVATCTFWNCQTPRAPTCCFNKTAAPLNTI